MPYVWIVCLALCVVAEAMTADLLFIWFFPASLISMLLAFCGAPWYWQVLAFLLVGVCLLLSTRPACKKWLDGKKSKTGIDALIGATALVTEDVSNINETGEVKVNGLRWSARTKNGESLPAGTIVTVLEIQGVKLIVKEKGETT